MNPFLRANSRSLAANHQKVNKYEKFHSLRLAEMVLHNQCGQYGKKNPSLVVMAVA